MDLYFFAPPASLIAALAFGLFGLLIGSFLNVVIHRMPKMLEREFENACAEHVGKEPVHTDTYTLSTPRSACPHCGHKISALENVPVISYLVLRGKCRGCKAKISPRYPIIELLSGLLAGWMVWQFGSGWLGMGAVVFGFMLIAMTFIDIDTQYLPDDLTLPLLWLGLLVNLNGGFASLHDAVLGAAAGYLVLWGVNALFKLLRKVDGMGGGDFKLLAALGAWMGWQLLPAIIVLSSVVGAVVGIGMMVFAGSGRSTKIPFGPYLAGAGLLALLFGPEISALSQTYLSAPR